MIISMVIEDFNKEISPKNNKRMALHSSQIEFLMMDNKLISIKQN